MSNASLNGCMEPLRNPMDALEHHEYRLTDDSRKNYGKGPYTYQHASGAKVVFHYKDGPDSPWSHWDHYGSSGEKIASSENENALGPHLHLHHLND